MSFEKNKYFVIKNAISKELADFVYSYFIMKRQVARKLFDSKYISPFTTYWGVWNDHQVLETYSHYGDVAMETLLQKLKPLMEEKINLKLNCNYSYARIYKKGDVLEKHKDRFSCEISTTLNLGGDKWPIFLEPNENLGTFDKEGKYIPSESNGVEINLEPGDMLVYRGNLLEHWRNSFQGENCGQVFLHYNNIDTKNSDINIYDTREFLGLPSHFRKFIVE
jgi:hypothetical protein